ncbi:MAG: hypothetical protein CVU43_00895 [Chloroflexi bacterium HGW-Chloroflexi-5]|jgi:hypothetical protein|nr:MAG: hypothetical protein CVU43_00895 [Chloroflexi bacterium HGW-Chloroflexi-5]
MKKPYILTISSLLVILILLLGVSGCADRPTPTPEVPTSSPTPEFTPTATPAPSRIVLFDPAAQASSAAVTVINDFAAANSLVFETWTELASDLNGLKIMVVFSGLDNLAEVAAGNPQTQFITTMQNVAPSANISTLAANPVHLAFMAGYLAAMTSKEWRAGALISDPQNVGLADAFTRGGEYLCGRCTPKLGPILFYPVTYTLEGVNDAFAWRALAQTMWSETYANSVYIDTAADFSEVLDVFTDKVLFSSNLASANLASYDAILGGDVTSTLQIALPELLAGAGGKTYHARVELQIINNPDVVSEAKQDRFNEAAQALADNMIIPLRVP